jgi:serine/threonine-protein kinase
VPEQFGRYGIVRKLGEGGMGAVYLVEHPELGQVALKVPHFTEEDGPDVIERFRREARSAFGIRHPNICPVLDVDQLGGVHYLVMPLIDGAPLSRRVGPGRPWEPREAVRLVCQLARALAVLHRKGLIHRDLKPANVMVDQAARMLATDTSHLLRMILAEKLPEYEERGRRARGLSEQESQP